MRGPAPGAVAVVTDSTSGLRHGTVADIDLSVVPLRVLLDGEDLAEGEDISAAQVGGRLAKAKRAGTSRPSPRAFLTAYEQLAGAGVTEIVSVHLSAQLSGTHDAAVLAARDAPVPVHVVDSGLAGAGLAYAVHAVAHAVREARSLGDATDLGATVRQVVSRQAVDTVTLFYVHTLEWLRRGGRIGAASAFLGGALAIKPLLELTDGHIEPVEKLRTQGRALARLQEVVTERATQIGRRVAVVVHHVDAASKAERLAEKLTASLAAANVEVGTPTVVPVPSALAVHVGPGALGVMLCPLPEGVDEGDASVAPFEIAD